VIARATRPIPVRAVRLRVGNLPFATTAADLQRLFGEAGAVRSVEVVYHAETGYPRGFAFVVMATPSGSLDAIGRFNGFSHGGRRLTVTREPQQSANFSRR
jgi:cold-inducible RNA-binding protein